MRGESIVDRVRRGLRSLVDAFSGTPKPAPALVPVRVSDPRDPRRVVRR